MRDLSHGFFKRFQTAVFQIQTISKRDSDFTVNAVVLYEEIVKMIKLEMSWLLCKTKKVTHNLPMF